MKIEYKEIDGAPGYVVGSDGSIWSCWTKSGPSSIIGDKWKKRALIIDEAGYFRISLRRHGKKKQFLVHRLVLEAFVGPNPNGLYGCHNNGKPTDNRPCNLRWDTQKGNLNDRKAHGTFPQGESHSTSKLTDTQVLEIRQRRANGETLSKIAERFGIVFQNVSMIVNRKTWTHLV